MPLITDNDRDSSDDYSSSDEKGEYDFSKPNYIRLPEFLSTNIKWNSCIYETKTIELFEVLTENCSLDLSSIMKRNSYLGFWQLTCSWHTENIMV